MKEISDSTKILGIPSLACFALAGAIYINSTFTEGEYHNYVNQSAVTIPAVKQYQTLESSLQDIKDSKLELTYYTESPAGAAIIGQVIVPIPAKYHSPDVDNSMKYLDSAHKKLSQACGNKVLKTLDDKVNSIKKDIGNVKRGESEKFYQPQITQLQEAYDAAEPELKILKKEIPSYVDDKQKSIKEYADLSKKIAKILATIGAIGTVLYVMNRSEE